MRKFAPWIISLVLLVWAFSKMLPPKEPPGFDVPGFGKLPVLVDGRVMPMDTLARLTLSEMNHHGVYTTASGNTEQPSRGLMEILMRPEHSDTAKLFEVSNQEVVDLFGSQDAKGQFVLYSFNELKPFFGEIEKQAGLAAQTEAETRNPFERGIIKLRDSLRLYLELKNTLQAEDSPDFGEEIRAFEMAIQPGLQAVRDRDANKPFNQHDFERILLFTQRYQNLTLAKYAYAIPNPRGSIGKRGLAAYFRVLAERDHQRTRALYSHGLRAANLGISGRRCGRLQWAHPRVRKLSFQDHSGEAGSAKI